MAHKALMSVKKQKEIDCLFEYLAEVFINLRENWQIVKETNCGGNIRTLVTLTCRKPICIPNTNASSKVEETKLIPYQTKCPATECNHKFTIYDNYRINFTTDRFVQMLDTLFLMREFAFQFMCLLSSSRGFKINWNNSHLQYLRNRMGLEYGLDSAEYLLNKYVKELDVDQIMVKALFIQMDFFSREPLFLQSFDEAWLLRVLTFLLLEELYANKMETPKLQTLPDNAKFNTAMIAWRKSK